MERPRLRSRAIRRPGEIPLAHGAADRASSPGGPVDAVARILAEGLRAVWPEPVIVENKPGAGNSTGAIFVAGAPPDGYTLLVITNSITVNPSLYANLDKDPLKQFAPVAVLVVAPQVLVARPDLPASDLAPSSPMPERGPAR